MYSKITLAVIASLLILFGIFMFVDSYQKEVSEATGLVVSEGSFPTYLETHPAINDMPKSASVELSIGKNLYLVNGKDVSEISEEEKEKDIKITLPEGYENVMGKIGLCESLRKASSENSLGFEIYSSKTVLLLKYRKLLKYRECLE